MSNCFLHDNARKLTLLIFSLAASTFLSGCLGGGGATSNATEGKKFAASTTDAGIVYENGMGGRASMPANPEARVVMLWTSPTTNTDGSTLTDLQSYNVHKGDSASNPTHVATVNANETNFTLENLSVGTHSFAVAAVNVSGAESGLSNLASKTIAN